MTPLSGQSKSWQVYVCDTCGTITDDHGEPVGCVNVDCDEPSMRLTTVAEVKGFTPVRPR